MSKRKYIKPRLPGGFRDFLPDEYNKRQWLLDKTVEVYKLFGFQPLETSAVEHFETLAGGDETSKQVYRLFNNQPDFSGESLALRFDLTVSLARVLATNRDKFNLPFKRYQIGYVWRGERQQRGRFKQFLQFDADIVGTSSPDADAEIVIIIDKLMKTLEIEKYVIKINNRKILNGFIRNIGLNEEQIKPFLRILDKMDRIGWDGVAEILTNPIPSVGMKDDNGEIESMGLDKDKVSLIESFVIISGSNEEKLNRLQSESFSCKLLNEGVDEIRRIFDLCGYAGIAPDKIKFDPALARGLDYYTGPVFETILTDLSDIGSIMSGGRYDNLLERFGKDCIPATGISLGVDRMMVALEELNKITGNVDGTKVLIVPLDDESEKICMKIAVKIRSAGIATEVFLGDNRKLKKQLTYANRKNIPYCIIIGGEELNSGKAKFKNMLTGEQKSIEIENIVEMVNNNLSGKR